MVRTFWYVILAFATIHFQPTKVSLLAVLFSVIFFLCVDTLLFLLTVSFFSRSGLTPVSTTGTGPEAEPGYDWMVIFASGGAFLSVLIIIAYLVILINQYNQESKRPHSNTGEDIEMNEMD